MSCPTKTYIVSWDQWQALIPLAAKNGLVLNGTKGTFSAHDCTFAWNYDIPVNLLHITCTSKPFIVGCDTVDKKLDEILLPLINPPAAPNPPQENT